MSCQWLVIYVLPASISKINFITINVFLTTDTKSYNTFIIEKVGEPEMSIDETVVKSITKYKYLGSIIQRNGEIDGNVNHRIHAGWLK